MSKLETQDNHLIEDIDQEIFEILGNLSWFLMDMCWILGLQYFSIFFIFPTIIFTCVFFWIDKALSNQLTNAAMLCWVLMNSSWMLEEYYSLAMYTILKKVFLVLGFFFIFASIYCSKSIKEALAPFKRFRLKKTLQKVHS
jgi:hypothetical protein